MTGTTQAAAGMTLAGRYQLVEPLAAGGMAQVWRGQDVSLVRPVAVKVLHPHLATDEAFVARFRREAVASARLSHSSIVAVYDTVSEGGIEAIVMELIEGRTLRAVLDEVGILPPGDVVDVGVQIADALDEAHRAGIVHRDIKPANIMVSTDRRILVTDFGIAKAQKDEDLTHTGTLLGTAKYLAPEQVVGEPVDPRADLYSLGVVLFEAATGKPPYVAETDAATALARLQGTTPRARLVRPTVPVGLDEVIARSMARQPNDRFDRASTMRAALTAVNLSEVRLDTSDLTAPTPPTPSGGPAVVTGQRAAVPAGAAGGAPANAGGVGRAPSTAGPNAAGPAVADSLPKGRKAKRDARKVAKQNQRGGQRPTRTIAAALIVGGLVVAGMLLLSMGLGAPDPVIAEVTAFDPQVGGEENNDAAPLAFDGDGETKWTTETYRFAPLSNLKDGVGLVVGLESEAQVDEVELITNSRNWSVEIYVGDDFGPVDNPDFAPADFGTRAGAVTDGEGSVTIDLVNAEGSAVLIWIIDTGITGDDEKVRFELFEARIS